MILQLFGACLLIAAFAVVGIGRSRQCEERRNALRAFCVFLRDSAEKMTQTRAAKDQVYQEYRDEYLEKIGFLPLLRRNAANVDAVQLSISELSRDCPLKSHDLEPLSFLDSYGTADFCEEEKNRMDIAQNKMKKILDAAEKTAGNGRPVFWIWLLLGFGVVLMLW